MKRLLIATVAWAAIWGCNRDPKVDVVPVSGVVKVNGQPAEGVGVMFQPRTSARGALTDASGMTDAAGRYTLSVPVTGQSGAMPGAYRVMFMAAEYPENPEDGAPPPHEPIPPKYNLDSTMTFEVPPGGTNEANFDLDIPDFQRTP